MKDRNIFDKIAQFALPALTIGATLLISLKHSGWGIVVNLAAQPFWLYSSWKAYKQAGQSGMLITTIVMVLVLIYGVINYFFIK